jgi:CheY-like chemotaxis protein/HAMP domain-containing protein
MRWWNKLTYRLSILIILLAVVPLALFGITAIEQVRSAMLASIERENRGLANRSANMIEATVAQTLKDVELVVTSNDFSAATQDDQEWYLQLLLKSIPHLQLLTIFDNAGKIKLKVGRQKVYAPDESSRQNNLPEFSGSGTLQPVTGDIYYLDNQLYFPLFIPLVDPMTGAVELVLKAEVDVTRLLYFTTTLQAREASYVYVVSGKGKVLTYPDRSVVLAGEDRLENPLVQRYVEGEKVTPAVMQYRSRDQVDLLTNVKAVGRPELLVVVEEPVEEALATVKSISAKQWIFLSISLAVAILLSLYFSIKTIRPLRFLEAGARRLGAGNLSHRLEVVSSDELGVVAKSFNTMAEQLENTSKQVENQLWLNAGAARLDALLRGEQSLELLCSNVIGFMAEYLERQVGIVYTEDGEGSYSCIAGYAFRPDDGFTLHFREGEGLTGQAVRDRKILMLDDIPGDLIPIASGLHKISPRNLLIVPFVCNDQVEAVMELGGLSKLTDLQYRFVSETAGSIAIIIASTRSRQELNRALETARELAEKLSHQQEELQASNEEMEEQTQTLMASEAKLKEQQEELQAANEELEEKTEFLERHKRDIENQNRKLETLGRDLEKKAVDLGVASRYKSEFLANMSHELRTPLNSMLLLAQLLSDNSEGNLTTDQVDSVRTIYNSGNDLLTLINEILDLSKIEAGKMELHIAEIPLQGLVRALEKNFRPMAEKKGLDFNITVSDKVPQHLSTDQQRVEQILRNFVSNALKFTPGGSVTIEIRSPDELQAPALHDLAGPYAFAIMVRDTGIGIPGDKQQLIFEAFQQLDSGTARKFGGTGLGLSISRQLARLLGGMVHLESRENVGSTFTLFLPETLETPDVSKMKVVEAQSLPAPEFPPLQRDEPKNVRATPNGLKDDRETISAADKSVLIIEDDLSFAGILLDFCRDRGFKVAVARSGENGLVLVEKYPFKAIILDINLPGIDGWRVLETIKDNPSLRHIPVHFISADAPAHAAFAKGAVGYLTKPVDSRELDKAITQLESVISKKMKELLLVEDDENQSKAIIKLISDSDVSINVVKTGREAMEAIARKQYDCMVLDLGLPDMSGFELLRRMEQESGTTLPPVVVHTGKELTFEEQNELRKYSESIIIKGARSQERLLDETSLFLHRAIEDLPEEQRNMIASLRNTEMLLKSKTILVVDDDMRNSFALARVLKEKGINVLKAENGLKALEILESGQKVDLVLMDIMMPVMDGYETMRRIRGEMKFARLPIIALTAKAMQRDKDNCLAAGANDYLAKPVDINRLLSMVRVWLYQ